VSFVDLLRNFWRVHNPTQGNRQGGDRGTQYRSGIYVYDDEHRTLALASAAALGPALRAKRHGAITTEIVGGGGVGAPSGEAGPTIWYAEEYVMKRCALIGRGARRRDLIGRALNLPTTTARRPGTTSSTSPSPATASTAALSRRARDCRPWSSGPALTRRGLRRTARSCRPRFGRSTTAR